MDNVVFQPPITVPGRVGFTKSRRSRHKNNSEANVAREPVRVCTLTRTKSLVHAAVRVWELKQRISD